MRKIETTNITGNQKAPFLKETFDQYTNNALETTSSLNKAFLSSYTTGDLVILHGCVVVATIPGTSSVTAGAIYYNGEIYQVDANASISTPSNTLVWNIVSTYASGDPVDWSDGTPRNLHKIDKFVLSNAATGTGTADYNATTVKFLKKHKRISLGDWNMDSTADLDVPHGLSAVEWLKLTINGITIIRDDSAQTDVLAIKNTTSAADNGVRKIDATNIYLTRETGGYFDGTDWNATSFNRGYIDITYGDI